MTDLLHTSQVRAMYMSDTGPVIEIINEHDEDDGEDIEQPLLSDGDNEVFCQFIFCFEFLCFFLQFFCV